jgi:hypothetical protein
MPFASSVFAAGAYAASLNTIPLGLCMGSTQQPMINVTMFEQVINDTDAYARTVLDAIIQGTEADWTAALMEWKVTTIAALWPYVALGRVLVAAAKYDYALPLGLAVQPNTLAACRDRGQ